MFQSFYITGAGLTSPYGEGLDVFVDAIHNDVPAIRPVECYEIPGKEKTLGGEIRNFNPKAFLKLDRVRGFDRLTLVVMEAIKDLYSRSGFDRSIGIDGELNPEDVGACLGTSGPTNTISEFDFQVIEDPQYVQPSTFPNCVSCAPLGYASIQNRILSFNTTLSNGATSSLDSLGFVSLLLENERCRMAVAGGAEVLSAQYELIMQAKYRLRNLVLPPLSEGAVVFSCESIETAKQRNAKPLAHVLGYSTCFHDNPSRAFEWNWKMVASSLEASFVEQPVYFYGSDLTFDQEESFVRSQLKGTLKSVNLVASQGYYYSASGGFEIAHALFHSSVPSGALVIVSNACVDGNSSLVALRKM